MPQMARLVSLALMAALIALLGITFYHVVAPFLMPLFLAGVLAMVCQPLYLRILKWTGQRTAVASGMTTAAALLLILVPALLGTIKATKELYSLAKDELKGREWKSTVTKLRNRLDFDGLAATVSRMTGEEVDPDELQQEIEGRLRAAAVELAQKTLGFVGSKTLGLVGSTLTLLGSAVSILVGLLIFGVALYYFLADGPALVQGAIDLIPVHRDYQQQLVTQFNQAVRAVMLATFAAALGQGITTGIGMYLFGFQHFFLVTLLATVTALVPLLGTWLVWGPYVIYLAVFGHWGQAISLAIYGAAFVGVLDNVIRTYVLQNNVKLHPLLAFVSVLGGIQVMGLWGIFIAPIIASCLHALVKIFNTELVAFSHERADRKTAPNKQPGGGSVGAAGNASAPLDSEATTLPMINPPANDDSRTVTENNTEPVETREAKTVPAPEKSSMPASDPQRPSAR